KPRVMDAHLYQTSQPAFRYEFIDISLADAGRQADQELVSTACLQPRHRFVQDVRPAAALVADRRGAFDANQRRDVAHLSYTGRDLIRDQLAVSENLKVAARMRGKEVEQFGVQKRFAAEDAEITVAVFPGVVNDPVQIVERQTFRRSFHIHPASLA